MYNNLNSLKSNLQISERAKMSQNLVLYTVNICHAAPNVIGITAHTNRYPHRTRKASRLATCHALLSVDLPWLWAHRLDMDIGKKLCSRCIKIPANGPHFNLPHKCVAKLEMQTKRFLTSKIGHFLLYNMVFSFHIAQIASKFGRIIALG